MGIVVPIVKTAKEQQIVAATRYPPKAVAVLGAVCFVPSVPLGGRLQANSGST
jgi:2-keto-3-deoxy-L-rhamnonate aldolase RhmA